MPEYHSKSIPRCADPRILSIFHISLSLVGAGSQAGGRQKRGGSLGSAGPLVAPTGFAAQRCASGLMARRGGRVARGRLLWPVAWLASTLGVCGGRGFAAAVVLPSLVRPLRGSQSPFPFALRLISIDPFFGLVGPYAALRGAV